MPRPWVFDATANRYRDPKTGRFIGRARMLALRDTFVEAAKETVAELAARVAQPGWLEAMREQLKQVYIDQYCLGRGGRNAMTPSDWGRVGNMLREQYKYLNDFAADIVAGKLSEAQIAARARLYMASSRQAFEKGKTYGAGIPPLPAYPADGSTACKSNCACYWSIEEFPNEYRCVWTLTAAEHCPDCLERASKWAPYRIPKF
jgi:hypothetical protein